MKKNIVASKMGACKNLCVLMFYIVLLLLASILFLYNSLVEYLKGDTQYVHTLEPISLNDLPTITACMTLDYGENCLIYGKDFYWEVAISEKEKMITALKENQTVPSLFGLEIQLIELRQSSTEEEKHKNS